MRTGLDSLPASYMLVASWACFRTIIPKTLLKLAPAPVRSRSILHNRDPCNHSNLHAFLAPPRLPSFDKPSHQLVFEAAATRPHYKQTATTHDLCAVSPGACKKVRSFGHTVHKAGSVRAFATCDLGPRTKLLDAAGTTRPDCRSLGSMRFIARLPRSSWSTRNSHPKEGSVNKSRVLNTELTVKSGSPLIRFHIC